MTIKAECHWDISEICLLLENHKVFNISATKQQIPMNTYEARRLIASLKHAIQLYEHYDEQADEYFEKLAKEERLHLVEDPEGEL